MSEPKFTPGPWFDWDAREWLYEPSKLLTNYEDACLIAAAPDLYAALAAIVADVDTEISDDEYGYARNAPVIVAARASLAKARGEA